MKKNLSILCVICMLLTILSISSSAEGTFTVSYDSETATVSVSGTSSLKTVITVIVKGDMPLSNLGDSKPPVCFMPFSVTDGKFSGTIGMPAEADSGKYTAYLSASDGNHLYDSFVFINIDEAGSVLEQISKKPADFTKIVDENAGTLGIDTEDEFWANNKSDILELLDVIKNDYTSPSQLYNDIYKAYALTYVYGNENDEVINAFKKYEPQLGIDFAQFFESDKRLTEDILKTLCTLISEEDYTSSLEEKSLDTLLNELKALAAVKEADDAIILRKTIEEDFSDMFSEMISNDENYQKISDKNIHKVYTKMMTEKISSFEDIVTAFETSAESVATPSVSVSGGSSGGTSFGGSSATIPHVKEEDNSGTKENVGTTPSNPANSGNFSDVSDSSWEYEAVSTLHQKGIINGYNDGTFKPANNVTRAEFTKIVYQAFSDKFTKAEEATAISNEMSNKTDITFSDISNQWYASYVSSAASAGIIKGSDGKFNPDNYIKREDAAVIIYNVFKLSGITDVSAPTYIDTNDISTYAYTSVGSLFKLKVMVGANDYFRPAATITRAESAQLVYNALNYLNSQN